MHGTPPLVRHLAVHLGVLFIPLVTAGAELKANFDGSADARFAEHTTAPVTPAMERLQVSGEQKLSLADWSAAVGGSYWYDNAPFTRSDAATGAIRENDTREARWQNVYIDYRHGGFSGRFGHQQVVWGETFGNAFADIINPKDFRQGPPLDAVAARRSIAMGNLKYVGENWSVQGILSPWPEFNVLPLPGSDFAPFPSNSYGFNELVIDRETHLEQQDPELGGRVSFTLGSTDLSLFYFDYYDRDPVYQTLPDTAPGVRLHLRESHQRMRTEGFTVASETKGFVTRAEFVRHEGRSLPVLSRTSILTAQSDETDIVGSVDFPTWHSVNFSFQVAERYLNRDLTYLLRRQEQTYLGLRALVSVFKASSVEILASHSLVDHGLNVKTELMSPLASNLEFRLGADLYTGPTDSELGRVQAASRVYAALKMFLSGFSGSAQARKR